MSKNVVVMGAGKNRQVSLLDVLDHVVNSGVVVQGSIVISLAGVDLIYLGLNVVLTSIETALRHQQADQAAMPRGKTQKIKRA